MPQLEYNKNKNDMYTALTVLLALIGYTLFAKIIAKASPDIYLYEACFDMLNIKYDCFDSLIYKDFTGIYIEDERFNNTTLYFDKKGKLVTK